MNAFVVGQRYKTTVPDFYQQCDMYEVGHEFTCHHVDTDGDWCGKRPEDKTGWCCATASELEAGIVVPV